MIDGQPISVVFDKTGCFSMRVPTNDLFDAFYGKPFSFVEGEIKRRGCVLESLRIPRDMLGSGEAFGRAQNFRDKQEKEIQRARARLKRK